MTPQGYILMVLHAHLPFVRHPEFPFFLEEQWYYEAMIETYVPLLLMMQRLYDEGVYFRLTMSLTPPLCAMMEDELLGQRFQKHLHKLIELAERERARVGDHSPFTSVVDMYRRKLHEIRAFYQDRWGGKILRAFAEMQRGGGLDIISCAATHGFLPLMEMVPGAVRAQLGVAVDDYMRHFGCRPQGLWLPECGYYPGLDRTLKEFGLRYFFLETHGVLHADRRPKYGVYAPLYCPSGVAAFGRDTESSKAVWSAEEGYPGDYRYREFYRDIGFDLPLGYIQNYIHPDGIRINTGLKYYKITGTGNHKEPYRESEALALAAEHAGNFLFNRVKQVEHLHGMFGHERKPLVVSLYDAELYGHWWYEGPVFLEQFFRKMHALQQQLRPVTAAEYLREYPLNQKALPSQSTWGNKGYNEVWLESSNDWIYRHLHVAAERMIAAVQDYPHSTGLQGRALNQMARELLLAQSSDWAFIMKTGTHVDYAVRRTREHLGYFDRLHSTLREGNINEAFLHQCESQDNVFPHINVRHFCAAAPTEQRP